MRSVKQIWFSRGKQNFTDKANQMSIFFEIEIELDYFQKNLIGPNDIIAMIIVAELTSQLYDDHHI